MNTNVILAGPAAWMLGAMLHFGFSPATGQNLVPNPGFEDTLQCPFFVSQIDLAAGWHTSLNTPDYYHACNNNGPVNPGMVGVPVSARGYQPARTGNAMAGEVNYWTQQADYRETFYTQLSVPLTAGVKYNTGMYVILNEDHAMWAIDGGLGIYVSATPINPLTPFIYTPQVANPTGNVLNDTLAWTEISGTFIAAGGEQYLTIGSFIRDTALTIVNRGGTHPFTSYAIDDVWLMADSLMTSATLPAASPPELSVYPNPAHDDFSIRIKCVQSMTAWIEVRDSPGRLHAHKAVRLRAGETSVNFYETKLRPGVYSIRLIAEGHSVHRSLVVF